MQLHLVHKFVQFFPEGDKFYNIVSIRIRGQNARIPGRMESLQTSSVH